MISRDYGLEELRRAAERCELSAPAVSRWTVGMQVHHCSRAMTGICRSLAESEPPPPGGMTVLGWLLLGLAGRIPRGRGRAPEGSLPKEDPSAAELTALLGVCEKALAEAEQLDPRSWWRHPVFGILRLDRALRLMQIHNRHHLRIIEDIVAAGSSG